jgi:hypothetical protein
MKNMVIRSGVWTEVERKVTQKWRTKEAESQGHPLDKSTSQGDAGWRQRRATSIVINE